MAERVLVLFDDAIARDFLPFTLTRPAGELLFGACLQRRRLERVSAARCIGHLAAPHLAEFDEPGAVRVLAPPVLAHNTSVLYLSSRAVPDWPAADSPAATALAALPAAGPALVTLGGEPCGWLAPPGTEPPPGFLDDPARAAPEDVAAIELGGYLLGHVWELVTRLEAQLARDIEALAPGQTGDRPAAAIPGVHVLGHAPVVLGRGVQVDPQVVLDTRHGPIWLDDGASVHPYTHLCGPAYVGPGSALLGGAIEGCALGPVCKVHGQLEASILLGFCNKAHAGFLGHAALGRWVNLGALTTNSDLKNNYRPVDVWTPAGVADTGEIKLGCFIGDHVKTGIGTLINTGTVIGAGSMLYGAELPPRHVPPFSWGHGAALVAYELPRFLEAAAAAMARRDVAMSDPERRQLCAAWRVARGT